jgi:hypothetical protein
VDHLKRTSSIEHIAAAFPVVREESELKTQEERTRWHLWHGFFLAFNSNIWYDSAKFKELLCQSC